MKVYRPVIDCKASPVAYKSKQKATEVLIDHMTKLLIEENEVIIFSPRIEDSWIDVIEVI